MYSNFSLHQLDLNSVLSWITGSGFHEDGFQAGKAAAQSLLGNKIDPLTNPKQMVLSWTETGARLLVLRFLKQYISVGNLILFEEGGTMFSFGEACEKCNKKSVLQVQDPLFYWQVLFSRKKVNTFSKSVMHLCVDPV
jgi:cyclopropane-fatty-acyl-phospholipid synthase